MKTQRQFKLCLGLQLIFHCSLTSFGSCSRFLIFYIQMLCYYVFQFFGIWMKILELNPDCVLSTIIHSYCNIKNLYHQMALVPELEPFDSGCFIKANTKNFGEAW